MRRPRCSAAAAGGAIDLRARRDGDAGDGGGDQLSPCWRRLAAVRLLAGSRWHRRGIARDGCSTGSRWSRRMGAAVWAGNGWLALALAVTSVTTTAFAVVSVGWVRRGLQVVGVVAAGRGVGGSVWLAGVGSRRRRRRRRRWWRVRIALGLTVGARWVALGSGLGRSHGRRCRWLVWWFSASALTDTVHVDRSPTGQALAAGLLAAAIAAALSAAPLALSWLRETTALLTAAAGAALIYGLERWWANRPYLFARWGSRIGS